MLKHTLAQLLSISCGHALLAVFTIRALTHNVNGSYIADKKAKIFYNKSMLPGCTSKLDVNNKLCKFVDKCNVSICNRNYVHYLEVSIMKV